MSPGIIRRGAPRAALLLDTADSLRRAQRLVRALGEPAGPDRGEAGIMTALAGLALHARPCATARIAMTGVESLDHAGRTLDELDARIREFVAFQ